MNHACNSLVPVRISLQRRHIFNAYKFSESWMLHYNNHVTLLEMTVVENGVPVIFIMINVWR